MGAPRAEPPVAPAKPVAQENSNKQPPKNDKCDTKSTGYPVVIATGEKHKDELDFASGGSYGLSLQRTYRSKQPAGTMFGPYWLSSLDVPKLVFSGTIKPDQWGPTIPARVAVTDANGTKFSYSYGSGPAVDAAGRPSTIQEYYSYGVYGAVATGELQYSPGDGWALVTAEAIYEYNLAGQIQRIKNPGGVVLLTYTYSASAPTKIDKIINAVGQYVQLTWGTNGRVTQVRDPAGSLWLYAYNASNMLTTVTSPGASPDIRTYHYESSDATLLTGISINAKRYSTYGYDTSRRAIVSGLAGDEERDTFVYQNNTTTVTNARGQPVSYTFTPVLGELKLTSVVRGTTPTCEAASAQTVYDAKGYVDYTLDWNGIKTDYTYDTSGRLLEVTTASGTTAALSAKHTWLGWKVEQTEYRDRAGITYARVNYTYHKSGYQNGSMASMTRTDSQTSVQRRVDYGYTFNGNGTIAGTTTTVALPAGATTTTTTYDSLGNVASVTNGLNQKATWSNFNGMGQPRRYVDINGVATDYDYFAQGPLRIVTATGNRTTTMTYNHDRQLATTSHPDGRVERFDYTDSGRLKNVGNAQGEFTQIAVDVPNNSVTQIAPRKVPSVSGAFLVGTAANDFSGSTVLDTLGRAYTELGTNGQRIDYRYDDNSNLKSRKDAAARVTSYDYDEQNRLTETTAPDGGVISTVYDSFGRVQSVTDQRGLQTVYAYNGFSDITSMTSPDTGTTTYYYDEAGRLFAKGSADGKTTNFAWVRTVDDLDGFSGIFGQVTRWGLDSAPQGT